MNDTPTPKPGDRLTEDAFRALCLMYLSREIDATGFAALTAELDADAGRRAMFVQLAMQVETVYEAFELNEAEQTAVELGIADGGEDAEADDAFDIMTMVVDQALAERRKHELEDEANRQLAAQQAEDARHRRFELQRQMTAEPHKRVVVIPQVLVWLGVAAAVGIAVTVAYQFNRPAPPTTSPDSAAVVEQESTTQPSIQPMPQPAPQPAPVLATLVRTLDARWSDQSSTWDGNLGLRQGRHTLTRGLVEIELAEGTRVVLEAPVSFDLTGPNTMSLDRGRLVAHVPASGVGFTVQTPTARIIDYGTEFGVDADAEGATSVHVFQGEVRAARRVDGQVVGESVPLHASQAAAIDAGGASIARLQPDALPAGLSFQRRVAKTLDLADLIVGGDGTTGYRDIGLHPLTGRFMRDIAGDASLIALETDGAAHAVSGTPIVSRVFIPPATPGIAGLPDGLTLAGLPATNGYGYGVIWCGQTMPSLDDAQYTDIPTQLPGYDFATTGRQTLVMHANAGLVLDLDALRAANPGFEVAQVRLVVGISSSRIQAGSVSDFASEFHVYLDDQRAAHHRFQRSAPDGQRVAEVDLAVPADARYLSLISTDGGDNNHQDWVVLGDPVVVLQPTEAR